MKYIIRDCQFECRYFADGAEFDSEKEILEQLASYHDIDFGGVNDNDEPHVDMFEFLATRFKTDEERLNWILAYGEWEIEEINKGE